jgi:LacI family transcriptional regulator
MPLTIRDVARHAGVSAATVSCVLNSSRQVDKALVERVQATVAELGYRPSRVARNLRVQTSSIWSVVVPDIGNPFFTRLVRAIQDEAWKGGRSLLVCNTDEDLEKEAAAIDVLVAERVGGVIIAPASEPATDLKPLLQRGVPVVAIDRRPAAEVDSVLADNRFGGAEATRELVRAGRRRLACITGPERATTARERLEGFREAVAEAGLPPPVVVHSDFRQDGGRAAMLQLLDSGAELDGVFVANNLMTIGVLEALAQRGRTIGVIGFDELPWAGGLTAEIPVVIQPTVEIGHEAVRMLAERSAGYAGPARQVVLRPEILTAAIRQDLAGS